MKDVHITVSIDEVNQILDALGQQPFVRVYQLIAKIQQQAQIQLRDESPAALALKPEENL